MNKFLFSIPLALCLSFTSCLPAPELPSEHPVSDSDADEVTAEKSASDYDAEADLEDEIVDLADALMATDDDTELLFHETFRTNKNNWPVTNDKVAYAQVRDGKYYFKQYRESDSSYIVINRKSIDLAKDWSIETTIKFVSGHGETTNFGLIFGYDYENDSGYKFLISDAGEFEISMSDYGGYEVIQAPTYTNILNQNKEDNVLKVEQRDFEWYFSINGKEVYSMSPKPFYAHQVGYILYNMTAIEVDDLIMYN